MGICGLTIFAATKDEVLQMQSCPVFVTINMIDGDEMVFVFEAISDLEFICANCHRRMQIGHFHSLVRFHNMTCFLREKKKRKPH
jgi:hypothetical protein